MKYLYLIFLFTFLLFSCDDEQEKKQNPIVYTTQEAQTDSIFYTYSPDGNFLGELHAKVDGKNYHLSEKEEYEFYSVTDQRDFDGDGLPDALVMYSESGGGNCCGSEYFVYSYKGKGKFEKTQKVGNTWNTPTIEKWKGKWSIVIVSNNNGTNVDDYEEVTERFVFDGLKLVKVEETKPVEIKALVEMRSKQFDFDNPEEVHELVYDLDEDQINDTIQGTLFQRWGTIMWNVKLGNGTIIEGPYPSKRIGVLENKTNGMHDLVGDLDDVIQWDGDKYE
jgi:hypothetical protein